MNLNATLLGQMITFAFFVFFTMKFVWPILEKTLEERKAKITLGLEAAEKGQKKLLETEKIINQKLTETKEQCAKIILQATHTSTNMVEEAKQLAKIEKERIITTGYRELEQILLKTKKELIEKVSNLTILNTEKILKREINEESHKDILSSLLKSF